MRKVACLFTFAILALFLMRWTVEAEVQEGAGAHVIEVTAKTFEFIPNEIHVRKGERVEIRLHSADRAHGLNLNLFPEGSGEDGNPGLIFEHPQDDAKVEKGKNRVIEFVAARAGTYDFKCSVQCSMLGHGHDRMTGKLIVDE